MKKLYILSLSVLLAAGYAASAQTQSPMPYPKKNASGADSTPANVGSTEGMPFKQRPNGNASFNPYVLPVVDQIHTPIRWYALENADNPNYWQHVNTERIWLELEVSASLTDPEIADFLATFGLTDAVKSSLQPHLTNFYVFEKAGTSAQDVITMAEAAREVPGVLFLEPSVIYTGQLNPNDPLWDQQWGPYAIYADVAWDYGVGGNSWNVMAVLDDAIDWLHEDQYNQVWYGYDYGFNDPDPTLDGAEQKHGTHVTGIMSATTNNGIGMAGMCNDTVYFAKVTDNTYFTMNGAYSDAAIINAMYDIADNLPRVTVINLSLGGGAPSAAAEQAYNYAWNNGKLPIAASGNEGNSFVSFPAAYTACMAVGSIGADGQNFYLTNYSNYGDAQEVCAPGGDINAGFGIVSTIPQNTYENQEGTSMACPMVAGLAGLMKNLNSDLTNVDIRNIISSTCFDFGNTGWDPVYGYGMINAQLAVETAVGQASSVVDLSPERLSVYPNPVSEQLWIDNPTGSAAGELQIFDIAGKLVQRDRLAPTNLSAVQVESLPQGVYVVRLSANDQLFTGRFVKSN